MKIKENYMLAYEIEEEFYLGAFHYEIVSQSSKQEEYAVRVRNEHGEKEWLKHPEARYETLGGARYAILMDAEIRVSKFIKIEE